MFFCEALLLLSWLFVTCSVQGGVTFKVQLCWHCWHCAATGEVTQARCRRSHESEKSLWLYLLFIIWRSKILLSAPLVLLLNVHFFVAVLYDRINTCSIIAVFFNPAPGGSCPNTHDFKWSDHGQPLVLVAISDGWPAEQLKQVSWETFKTCSEGNAQELDWKEYLNCLNQMPGQMYNPAHSFFD